MDYEDLQEFVAEEFPDEWDTSWADSEELGEGMEYMFSTGGKRLRPLVALKTAEMLGGDMEATRIFARAIESFHNFSLVHDDIMDGDRYRRDEKAVWYSYGMSQGINIGNGLHILAYRYLAENAEMFGEDFPELLKMFNRVTGEVIDGQSLDLRFNSEGDVSEKEYMEMVRKKTGALIGLALRGAAVISDADRAVRDEVEAYGRAMGPAFQIRDDVIDIVGEKGREKEANDIREGKRSLIVVYALERLGEDEREELVEILDRDRQNTSKEEVERAIELFRSVGAIEDANARAEELAEDAKDSLELLSDDYDVEELEEITDFLVERKF